MASSRVPVRPREGRVFGREANTCDHGEHGDECYQPIAICSSCSTHYYECIEHEELEGRCLHCDGGELIAHTWPVCDSRCLAQRGPPPITPDPITEHALSGDLDEPEPERITSWRRVLGDDPTKL